MNTKADPNSDDTLAELAALGMQTARVVARMMAIEQEVAEVVVCWLPEGGPAASLAEAEAAGRGVDAVAAAMADAVPRIAVLARAFDRVSRSVRRSVALRRRIEAGWPRAGSADDRQAMVRRQVARGVGEAIARSADGEAAERLFDDLAERLDDPGLDDEMRTLPVAEVVRLVCRDLGLATRGIAGALPAGPEGVGPPTLTVRERGPPPPSASPPPPP